MAHRQNILAWLAFGAAQACGDATDVQGAAVAQADGGGLGAAVQGGNQDLTAAAKALVSAYCARVYQCQPHDAAIDYTDLANCAQRELVRVTSAITAAGASSGESLLVQCAAIVNAASCDAIRYGGPPRCYFAAGQRAKGAPCVWDSQCQGKVCQRQGSEACGACATEGQVGDLCSPRTCAAGLACVFDVGAKSYRCRTRGKQGDPCNDNLKYEGVCGYGLVCQTGQCTTAGAKGAPCPTGGCDHDLGLDCHKETKVCMAIPMGAAGASCSINAIGHELYKECADGLCLNRNDMGNGTCLAYAPDGGKCASWAGPACRVPALCVQGVCKVLTGSECP